MLIFLFNCFVKITGYIAQLFCFRTKKYYESEAAKKIPRGALIVSNHTSVYDYAVYLFVFFSKTLRVPMAEVLFEKKLLKLFLTMMGGIFVNRDSADLSFVYKCADILSKKGDVLIFPEGRIPKEGEVRPLEFKPSVGMLALLSGAPIIPVYTNGSYFKKSRAKVVIGESFSPVIDDSLSDKEKAISAANQIREKIIKLGGMISDGEKDK